MVKLIVFGYRGEFNDVSMGHLFYPDSNKKVPIEVSSCAEGRRDGTHVSKIRILKHSKLAQKYPSIENEPWVKSTRPIVVVASKKMPDETTTATTNIDAQLDAIKIAEALKAQLEAANNRLAEFERIKAEEETRKADEAVKTFHATAQNLVDSVPDPAMREEVAASLNAQASSCGTTEAIQRFGEFCKLITASMSAHARASEAQKKADALAVGLSGLVPAPRERFVPPPAVSARPMITPVTPSPVAPVLVNASKNSDPNEARNRLVASIVGSKPVSQEGYNSLLNDRHRR